MKNISAIKILEEKSIQITVAKYPNIPSYAVPKTKYTDKTSNGLTKCVIHWIEYNGFQAERINSTGRQIDNTKIVTDVLGRTRTIGSKIWIKGTGQTGTADISATILGRSVKIEIKCKAKGDNYQSHGQMEYQKKIERSGGIYIIVRTFDDFYNWYLNFKREYNGR
ncbi:hypothetical protein PXD56_13705 [Maribacter sp. SA7]|uniref:hypothetical protein n=1 Tax=Maribacter zhoushanensis TaxID=3030012 RepID=UPI0023ED6D44|nr:hypothetical protein [Maribacter zhoushanensis]MDF4204023.1 hypothetical protein [Maribacter zhoushanensis]